MSQLQVSSSIRKLLDFVIQQSHQDKNRLGLSRVPLYLICSLFFLKVFYVKINPAFPCPPPARLPPARPPAPRTRKTLYNPKATFKKSILQKPGEQKYFFRQFCSHTILYKFFVFFCFLNHFKALASHLSDLLAVAWLYFWTLPTYFRWVPSLGGDSLGKLIELGKVQSGNIRQF